MTDQGNDVTVGSRIGRLTLTDRIGHGGFSIVYQAHDEALDTNVAVKVLADNHSLDPEIRTRFLAEGRVLRKVAHPSLIQIFDVGETDTHRPYLVLQLASGGTLAERAAACGGANQPVTRADLTTIVDGLESALSALHNVGVVHRDISPTNIFIMQSAATIDAHSPGVDPQQTTSPGHGSLLQPGERYVLGDLGLAKDLGATSGITVGGGTPQFAAPEQQRPAGIVTPTADVYGASRLLRWVAANSPLAELVDDLTASGVSNDPDQRPQTIAAWASHLRRGLAEEPPPAEPELARPPSKRGQLRTRTAVGLTILCLAGLGGLAFWAYNLSQRTTLASSNSDNIISLAVDNSVIIDGWGDQSWSYQSPFDDTGTIEFASFGALSLVAVDPIDVPPTVRLVGVIQPADAPVAIRVNGETYRPCPLAGSNGLTFTDGDNLRFEIPSSALGTNIAAVDRISLINTGDNPLSLQLSYLALETGAVNDDVSPLACGP